MKKMFSSDAAPEAVGPYSQAIEANGFLFLSGQIGLTLDGELIQESIRSEVEQIMKNLENVLISAGLGFDSVVKTEIYLTNVNDFAIVNQVYASFLKEPYPARATVAVKELPKGARVEISMVAVKS